MDRAPSNLPADYWSTLQFGKKDLEYVTTYLFENEIPLTEKEILPVVVAERVRLEREALIKEQQEGAKIYVPKGVYKTGDRLAFPALGWKKGTVTGSRPGVNPAATAFDVIAVKFEDSGGGEFAAGLEAHVLNSPAEVLPTDESLDPNYVLTTYGAELETKLVAALEGDGGLARIAGRWFARALLVDVNLGHLNLAEAALDEAGGRPLPAQTLIEQVELSEKVNPKLLEFSMNFALQEDGRFDEVGPAGEVLWCLKRLEPQDVQQIPVPLRYASIEYDRAALTPDMLSLEEQLDDELSDLPDPLTPPEKVLLSLTYPHWRAGTLPISARMRGLFPTAYVTPRIIFTVVDGATNEELQAWVVRQHGYVAGLGELFKKHGLMPGSLIAVRRGDRPGQVVVEPKVRRPTRDWIRTVLVGSDGGIVFAMLKQNISTEFNERMVIAVPDVAGVDQACAQLAKDRPSFEKLVLGMLGELTKLNVQGHVHAQELYSALNIVRRVPPGPLLTFLAGHPEITHIGDLHFRLVDQEVRADD
ncbi:MAG: hypothetical protein JXB85_03215 [Anaerolineales bacterium]|nr:hypothetical protein [Anaerolineales bacterium]